VKKKTKAVKSKPAKTKAVKTVESKPTTREPSGGEDRAGVLGNLIRGINAKYKATVISLAKDTSSSYILRRPTGITSLDIKLGGGFPASAVSVIVGPDGAGKDYIVWRTAAEVQKIYGESFRMAILLTEFKLDKPFMRDICGLKVALTPSEIEELDESRTRLGVDILTDEERESLTTEIGEIGIIEGQTAEDGFDILIDIVEKNVCQLVVVNSIGFMQTAAKEATDSFNEFPQQRNEAMLLTKVMPKLSMILNRSSHVGERNETAIILINQMRAKTGGAPVRGRPVMERDTYQPGSGAWALKHGKALELCIHKGKKHTDVETNVVMGREVPWQITKGKLGTHDGLSGSFDFFYDGGVDIIGDLYNTAVSAGLFVVGGAWITYEHPEFGFKAQGKAGARRRMIESPELCAHIRDACFRAAQTVYRHK